MSHKIESGSSQSSDMSVALGVLGMFFLFLLGFLGTTPSTVSTTIGQGGQDSTQVAMVSTEPPTATPVPATPTSTMLPPATFTAQPSSTSIPPTATVLPQPTAEQVADTGTTAYDPALIAQGQQLFVSCSACHGPDAHGLPNLGKDLVISEFVHSLSDEDLLTFIKTGRPIWDTLNTTGVDMPPRGGNPTLTDEDLLAIIAYLRSLAAESGSGE